MNDVRQAAPAAATLRVLGIDPGLADVGYGVVDWDGARRQGALVTYGVVRTPAGQPLAERLDHIYRVLEALIERELPQAVAIEELFFAKNVKTAMVVAHGRAACILATARRQVPLFEYTPLQIKQALTGHGRAGKEQVQRMVRVVLGLAEVPRPDHAADALAAAVCHAQSLGLAEKVARARELIATATVLARGDGESTRADEPDPRKLLLAQARGRRRRRY